MENYCAYSKDHKCIKWIDYQITRHELEEADTLCHGNMLELERKNEYIEQLQRLLNMHDIPYPDEFDLY